MRSDMTTTSTGRRSPGPASRSSSTWASAIWPRFRKRSCRRAAAHDRRGGDRVGNDCPASAWWSPRSAPSRRAPAEERIASPALIVIGEHRRHGAQGAPCWKSSKHERARHHRRRAALRLRQDQRHHRPDAGAEAARTHRARREIGTRLYRSRLSRRRDRPGRRQPRQLGDGRPTCSIACSAQQIEGADYLIARKRDGPVRRHPVRPRPQRRCRRARPPLPAADAARARRFRPVADGGGHRPGFCDLRSGCQDRRRGAQPGGAASATRLARDRHRGASACPVVGAICRNPDMVLPERHLGLVQASEHAASTPISTAWPT